MLYRILSNRLTNLLRRSLWVLKGYHCINVVSNDKTYSEMLKLIGTVRGNAKITRVLMITNYLPWQPAEASTGEYELWGALLADNFKRSSIES